MSNKDETKTASVPSQAAALSCSAATSLARRGMQDLLARAEADEWYKEGRKLWEQQQYGEAVACFRRGLQLDSNQADLQFYLGRAYDRGDGVPKQDFAQAATWWRKAAEQGHAPAQSTLGYLYFSGKGVPQDDVEAATWWRKAADQGHAEAQFSLGMGYSLGRGVMQDHAQGASWYRKSAEQGFEPARQALDDMLRKVGGMEHKSTRLPL
jgi:uncharacterized protein